MITKIRFLRLQRDIALWDFARKLGISIGYLSQIERRQVVPKKNVMQKAALLLDCDVDQLLDAACIIENQ